MLAKTPQQKNEEIGRWVMEGKSTKPLNYSRGIKEFTSTHTHTQAPCSLRVHTYTRTRIQEHTQPVSRNPDLGLERQLGPDHRAPLL